MIRIAILSNQDPVSNQLFSTLFGMEGVEIVGIGLTTTLTSKKSFIAGLYEIFRKTGVRYFIYQSAWAVIYGLKSKLVSNRKLGASSLFSLAKENRIPLMKSADFNSENSLSTIREWKPDLIVTRVNQIFKKDLISIAPKGMWCCHSSLLPKYRGIAAEFHVLRKGDSETGFTLYRIDEKLDSGDIIEQVRFDVDKSDTVYSLTKKSIAAGKIVLCKAVRALIDDDLKLKPQEANGATYYSWPRPDHIQQFKKRGRLFVNFYDVKDMIFN